MNRILIDEAGYSQLSEQIELIRKQINEELKHHFNPTSGNIHDCLDPVHDENRLNLLGSILVNLENMRAITQINQDRVSEPNDLNAVQINDLVTITLASYEYFTEQVVRIVYTPSSDASIDGVTDVTVNSPLGQTILNKPVGNLAEYQVDGTYYTVMILDKKEPELGATLS